LGSFPRFHPLIERAMQEGVHYHHDLVNQVLASVGE
jgi:hypothetical protein